MISANDDSFMYQIRAHFELQELHLCLLLTLEKAVVQLLATVVLAESHTFRSAAWAMWGKLIVTMAGMLQSDVNVS